MQKLQRTQGRLDELAIRFWTARFPKVAKQVLGWEILDFARKLGADPRHPNFNFGLSMGVAKPFEKLRANIMVRTLETYTNPLGNNTLHPRIRFTLKIPRSRFLAFQVFLDF